MRARIDDMLLREMFDTSSDVKYEVLIGWSERDEPEDKLLQSEILVAVYYEKERLHQSRSIARASPVRAAVGSGGPWWRRPSYTARAYSGIAVSSWLR